MGKKNEKKIDEFLIHEALDRTSIIINIIEDNLYKHKFIQNDEKARELLDEAQEILGDLYQYIGNKK